jgi:DnaJ-class molecular chaperone
VAQDPYKVLGVARGASDDEIRKAFRKLAKELHPDRNPGDKPAEERFKQVSAAFDILGDVDKRKKFDRGEIDADGRETMRGFHPGGGGFGGGGFDRGGFGQGGFGQGGFGQGGFGQHGFGQNAGAQGSGGQGFDFDDIVSEMFSGRGSAGFGGGQRGFSHKGADVRFRLEVDLEDAIRGGSKRISLPDGRILDVNIPKGAPAGPRATR